MTLEFVNTPTFAEMVTFFGAGMVDVSVLTYTSFIGLYDKGAPVKIVGGGGIEGCVIVAQPGLDTPAKLKGKTLGTFQMDTLEVLPYDCSRRTAWLSTRSRSATWATRPSRSKPSRRELSISSALRLGPFEQRQGASISTARATPIAFSRRAPA